MAPWQCPSHFEASPLVILAVTADSKHHQRSGKPLNSTIHSFRACWLSFLTIYSSFDSSVFKQPPQTPSSVLFKGSVTQLQWLGISFWLGRQPASLSTWDCCHHPTSWYCHFFSIKESSPSCWVNGSSGRPCCRWPYSKGKPICRSCATMHRKWLVCPLFCCGSWLPWLCFTILVSLPWIAWDTKLNFPQTSKWM